METYVGYIKTPHDALIIFEACRRGHLARIQRRLSSKERVHIRSGSVFAWDEREAGMRRWTDGRMWSPSRVLGSFLTYHELDPKSRPRRPQGSKSMAACVYKPNGLIKQSFSICTAANQKMHLIAYYTKSDVFNGHLKQPSMCSLLGKMTIPRGLYPELNPLDTSGGHSTTLHSLRLIAHEEFFLRSTPEDHNSVPLHPLSPATPPPSLSQSTSPTSTVDEDVSDTCLVVPGSGRCLLPTKDIVWESIPSSEDLRQLRALHAHLRI